MGYADGFYYGQGRIICDTSTFSVGDTIRVRSMTDSSKVWNQQVATVGTALVFTVPCYDYYKICTVQDIGGVATEVGGVYKTVDYGQTLYLEAVLNVRSLSYIQSILNSHNENILNIGDEVEVEIDGYDITFQLIDKNHYQNHEAVFGAKYIYGLSKFHSAQTYMNYPSSDTIKPYVDNIFSLIADKDKKFLKDTSKNSVTSGANGQGQSYTSKLWLPTLKEIDGTGQTGSLASETQFAMFIAQANRIKTYNGTATAWWTSDGVYNHYEVADTTTPTGGVGWGNLNVDAGVVPFFRLTADS